MIVGLHHVAIGVPDLDQGIAFYAEHFGFELVNEFQFAGDSPPAEAAIGLPGAVARGAMMKTSNAFIEVWQYSQPAPRDLRSDPADLGYVHIALQVRDIEAEHKRLTEAGMTFVGDPVDFGGSSAIYGRDPFGNVVELYELREPNPHQLSALPGVLAD